jgi:hypothetical protein
MITKTNGLSYVGNEHAAGVEWSRYTLFLEGRRVFDALVNLADDATAAGEAGGLAAPDGMVLRHIAIAKVDAPIDGGWMPTKGFAAHGPHFSDAGVFDHVDGKTVEAYVAPRAAFFLARLFVPPAESA